MKAVIQRVKSSSVKVDGETVGEIGQGYLVLLGVMEGDTRAHAKLMADKVSSLRIFCDENDKMNKSVIDIEGEILAVSQFTLCADVKKGNRPSFIQSAKPETANELYEYFMDCLRENGVRLKLSSLKDIVRGKRVVLIDDSIVRGTTSRRIVHLLKDSGASEVHVRIASPLYAYPCFYGVDTSTRKELIGSSHTVEEIRDIIGADTLAYLSTDGLLEAGRRSDLCMACFDGKYPTELYDNAAQLEI